MPRISRAHTYAACIYICISSMYCLLRAHRRARETYPHILPSMNGIWRDTNFSKKLEFVRCGARIHVRHVGRYIYVDARRVSCGMGPPLRNIGFPDFRNAVMSELWVFEATMRYSFLFFLSFFFGFCSWIYRSNRAKET